MDATKRMAKDKASQIKELLARKTQAVRPLMFEWIEGIINGVGYPGLLFLAFIENIFPPIPSELIMPFGGYLARKGEMNFWLVVLFGTLGATLGSLPLYYAGRAYGEKRLKKWADKYGKWLGVDASDITKSKKWFVRHQTFSVFWCRMVPGIRSIIAIPAGLNNVPLPSFLGLTFAGCFVWTLFLATLGYFLGEAFRKVDKFLGPVSWVVIGGILAWLVWRGFQKRK